MASIYDSIFLGPLELRPEWANGDAIYIEPITVDENLEVQTNDEGRPVEQPYDPNGGSGGFCIPIKVWEQVQAYDRDLRLV